ncbi:amino acid adenylation domain-containing protein [Streptomyces sp. NPDC052721]|uniref:non-ribosomal peptide synthetase n=1 Tax=Streptomyces sp. NPDC052721 TaxID=3154955 RepID=UPI00342FCCB4
MRSNESSRTADAGRAEHRAGRTCDLGLTHAQQQMWFADQLNPQDSGYLIPLRLRLTGELDVAALGGALQAVVARHEVLRTGVRTVDDRPVGVLRPASDFTLAVADLREAGPDEVERELLRQARTPLELPEGLPVRATLLRVADTEHILCLTVHHMAFDGGSRDILHRELEAGYAALVGGAGDRLAPEVVRYAEAERARATEDLDAQLDHWREALAGLTPFELPPDRPRPAHRAGRGAQRSFDVPRATADGLDRLARRGGATTHMVLVAACQALLARWSGRTDVTVGSTFGTRDEPALREVIGPFVNMLVLRGDVSGDPSFTELVERVRETALDAYEARHVPFADVVRELGGDRDPARTPLFQILVDQVTRSEPPALPGLTVTELPEVCVGSKYDLSVSFQRVAGRLTVELTWDTALYEDATAGRLARHLRELLVQVAQDPGARVSELVLTDERERQEALGLGRGPVTEFQDVCLHELFEAQVSRTPGAPAVADSSGELTYAQLDARATALAAVLRARGVGPEVPAGIMFGPSTELVVAVLGVLKAGGAYLPIDPAVPPHRLAHVLTEARPALVLTQPRHAGLVASAGGTPLTSWDEPGAATDAGPLPRPDNLCALYYTSGSTGRPKAVACTHRGWSNYVQWLQRQHRLRPGETVLHKCVATFDVMVAEVLWPLCSGGRVAVLGDGRGADPRAVIDAAVRFRAAQLQFVPSALDLFLDELTDDDLAGLGALRSVVSGGEALLPGTVRRFFERFGDRVRLDNNWGTTETSVDSTTHRCAERDPDRHPAAMTVGLPVDNHEVHILDEHGRPAPLGTPGEIHVGGVGLARGYHANPARTAERFVPHPFRPGARLYRTGDQGRVRADGSIEYLGRADHQVKIRGARIELGEVEAALRAHPAVVEAAAATWQAAPGDRRLAAYVLLNPAAGATTADVRAFLAGRLLGSALPSVIVEVDAFPRLPNGKLDRAALPAPDLEAARESAYVAPRDETEAAVAAIWSELLGTTVGAHDNFFASGGHSLLVTRAANRMREAFGVPVPLSLVFEAPTVAQTASRLTRMVEAEIDSLSAEELLRLLAD